LRFNNDEPKVSTEPPQSGREEGEAPAERHRAQPRMACGKHSPRRLYEQTPD